MDWFSWLSKTGLEPSLVYEYGLAFAHNELEEEDIAYFNHEFLQSMGISIAKHRLEILKLARKEKGGNRASLTRVLAAIRKSTRRLSRYIDRWIRREESALVVVQRPSYSSRWKGALSRRNKKLVMIKQGRLLLTNGTPKFSHSPSLITFGASPTVYHLDSKEHEQADEDDDDGYWSSTMGVEQIRWDSMFQDLKPT